MRIAEVVGTVTLNHCDPSLKGACLKLAFPLSLANLTDREPPGGDVVVVFDELGAGLGMWLMLSEGREASHPFFPDVKPIDAYNAGLIDQLQLKLPPTATKDRPQQP